MNKGHESDTAQRLLEIAESVFAEKGFYGASIRLVAERLPVAKSTLLHHYPSKEKLYGAVLKRLADEMTREVQSIRARYPDEKVQLKQFLHLLAQSSIDKPNRDQILLRELLDNPRRIEKARKWFFGDYFTELTGIVRSGQQKSIFKPFHPEVFILQLLGAHRYLVISLPTMKRLLAPDIFTEIIQNHTRELERFVEQHLLCQVP